MKIRDFHYFLFEPTKNDPKCWCKMIVRTMVEICAKFLIYRLKIGGAMAIPLVAMATATLIFFLMQFLSSLRQEFRFTYFSGSLVDSFCSLCLFSESFRRKDVI